MREEWSKRIMYMSCRTLHEQAVDPAHPAVDVGAEPAKITRLPAHQLHRERASACAPEHEGHERAREKKQHTPARKAHE